MSPIPPSGPVAAPRRRSASPARHEVGRLRIGPARVLSDASSARPRMRPGGSHVAFPLRFAGPVCVAFPASGTSGADRVAA